VRAIFAVFGLLLIIVGTVLVLVPREAPPAQTRGAGSEVMSLAVRARDLADQVNGPLSILFGVISLYYSRKRYIVARDSNAGDKTG